MAAGGRGACSDEEKGFPLPLQPRESNNAQPRSQAERAHHRPVISSRQLFRNEGWSAVALIYSRSNPVGLSGASSAPDAIRSRRDGHQTDVPTQEALPAQDARLSHTYGDAGWPPGAQGTPSKGPQAPDSGSHAMNPRHRLAGRRRIAAVRESGREARSGAVRIRALPGESHVSRVAFAVPGATGAVGRNRARRRLRAAIAPVMAEHAGLDMVVSLHARATEMPFLSLRSALATALTAAATSSRQGART
jgi:ribonuclease P protein component